MGLNQVPSDVMAQLPPGAQPVDAIPGSNGGWIVLGRDGGVFALGGAQLAYSGNAFSYTTLPPQQGTRSFSEIRATPGGYTLVSDRGEQYQFGAPPATVTPAIPSTPSPAATPTTTGPTDQQVQSAKASALAVLTPILGADAPALLDTATNAYINSGGSSDAMMQAIRQSPQYQAKFPGMAARAKAGLPPITEADYLNIEATIPQSLRAAGMDPNIISKDDITNLIANDVSPAEFAGRVTKAVTQAMQAPPEFRQALATLGVDTGQIAHLFADPNTAMDSIMSKAAIGAQALEQGYGSLSSDEMAQLQGAGVSEGDAKTRFGSLYHDRELLEQLPGQQGSAVDRATQMAYAQGLAPAEEQLQKAGQQRAAEFQGGGGVETTSAGALGAGVAR